MRPSARERGYSSRWDKARATFLRSHPWCVMCAKQGARIAASVVDHIIPHKGDQLLFWNKGNWQSLCAPHHNSTKQAIETRGYSSEIGSDGLPVDPRHPFYRG
jgi:5-methylcytosine-specific restriction endonuclease McrA